MAVQDENRKEKIATVLDLRGLKCPLPLMRTKKKLKDISSGEELVLLVTDPATRGDLSRFCSGGRCVIVDHSRADDCERYVIERL